MNLAENVCRTAKPYVVNVRSIQIVRDVENRRYPPLIFSEQKTLLLVPRRVSCIKLTD